MRTQPPLLGGKTPPPREILIGKKKKKIFLRIPQHPRPEGEIFCSERGSDSKNVIFKWHRTDSGGGGGLGGFGRAIIEYKIIVLTVLEQLHLMERLIAL